jgi:diguanylate cyclase (GGDEF)-like protein
MVIKELADVIKSNIRESDIAVRYGGEEFIILLHHCSLEGAMKVAEKIRSDFRKRVVKTEDGQIIESTVSIGVAHFPTHADSIVETVKLADNALYQAKREGRNRVVIFSFDGKKDISQE